MDSPLRGLSGHDGLPANEIRQAPRRALEKMIEFAVREEVKFVIIAGDIYDGDLPDSNTGLFFHLQLQKLRNANIPVYIIYGNHDARSGIIKNMPSFSGVHVFDAKKAGTVSLSDDDAEICLHGQSFGTRSVSENLARNYPSPVAGCFNIGILHTSLGGYQGHDNYAPCSRENLTAKGYDYWALGHIHKREELLRGNPCWVVYPGNLQGRHIGEADGENRKGATLVTVENGVVSDVRHEPFDEARWAAVKVKLEPDDGEDGLHEKIRQEFLRVAENSPVPVIARLTVSGRAKANDYLRNNRHNFKETVAPLLASETGGRIWLEKIRINTEPLSSLDDAGVNAGDVLRGFEFGKDGEADAVFADVRADLERISSPHALAALKLEPDSFLAKLHAGDCNEIAEDIRNDLLARIRLGE